MYCGYPLVNTVCLINGIEYDFSEELPIALLPNDDYYPSIGKIRKKTHLGLTDACNLVDIIRDTKAIPSEFVSKYQLESTDKYEKDNIKNIPKIICPICQSTNLSKISITSKAVKIGLFGIFGAIDDAGKTWKCNNCGSKF